MAAEQAVPPDRASSTSGAEAGVALLQIDLPTVPDDRLIGVLQGCWREISQLHAQWWATMVEIGRRQPPVDESHPWRELASWEWGSNQIAAGLTFTARRADTEYQLAQSLVLKLPLVFAALQAGVIDPPKAKVFVSYLAELTDPQIARISARLLPRAPGWTTGQLAYRLLREVLAIDPGCHEHAVASAP